MRTRTRRPTTSWCACAFLFILVVVTVNEPALVQAGHGSPPSHLSFYVHGDLIGNTTVTVVQGANGSPGTPAGFGTIRVFDWVVQEGVAGDSPVLGEAGGTTTTLRDGSLYFTAFYAFDLPSYSSTLTTQNKAADRLGNGEGVITGGTGDFRWARGYVDLQLIFASANFQDVVYHADLHIRYD